MGLGRTLGFVLAKTAGQDLQARWAGSQTLRGSQSSQSLAGRIMSASSTLRSGPALHLQGRISK